MHGFLFINKRLLISCDTGIHAIMHYNNLQVYDMQSSVKGRAVIIKNFIYEEDTKLKQRSNVDCDAYRLENSLKRLRFKVKQYVNQSAEVSILYNKYKLST